MDSLFLKALPFMFGFVIIVFGFLPWLIGKLFGVRHPGGIFDLKPSEDESSHNGVVELVASAPVPPKNPAVCKHCGKLIHHNLKACPLCKGAFPSDQKVRKKSQSDLPEFGDLEPPTNEAEAQRRRYNWNAARAELQRVAYGMVNSSVDPKEKAHFTAFMVKFASRDPLYLQTIPRVKRALQENGPMVQSEIYKGQSEKSKEMARYVLYFAALIGDIDRVKKGRSYELRLPELQEVVVSVREKELEGEGLYLRAKNISKALFAFPYAAPSDAPECVKEDRELMNIIEDSYLTTWDAAGVRQQTTMSAQDRIRLQRIFKVQIYLLLDRCLAADPMFTSAALLYVNVAKYNTRAADRPVLISLYERFLPLISQTTSGSSGYAYIQGEIKNRGGSCSNLVERYLADFHCDLAELYNKEKHGDLAVVSFEKAVELCPQVYGKGEDKICPI